MILKQQITLYVNYISFFHVSQKKQFTRLLTKLQEFDVEVEENINVNFMSSIDDIDDAEPMNEFYSMDETSSPLEIAENNEPIKKVSESLKNDDVTDNGELMKKNDVSDNGESNTSDETFSDNNNDF